MLRRAAREHRRWITKPSAILSHRIYIADVYTSIADLSPMCRRCVWDIFGLGVHRRMFADISPMVFGVETSGENFNACIEIFQDVPMPWRSIAITRVRRQSFAEPLVHGGAALAMPKFVHRESIGRLKKPRGTVGWDNTPNTGFEIWTLAVWGRTRYLSFTEKKHFVSLKLGGQGGGG